MGNDRLPVRKNIRLRDYDYSQAGYYFITICTQNNENFMWSDAGVITGRSSIHDTVGAIIDRPLLTSTGEIIVNALKNIGTIYTNVSVDDYVIMPDHIHFILVIMGPPSRGNNSGRPVVAPTVSRIIQQFKGYVAKKSEAVGFGWQKSYYEHIIRSEQELKAVREYIENNPAE